MPGDTGAESETRLAAAGDDTAHRPAVGDDKSTNRSETTGDESTNCAKAIGKNPTVLSVAVTGLPADRAAAAAAAFEGLRCMLQDAVQPEQLKQDVTANESEAFGASLAFMASAMKMLGDCYSSTLPNFKALGAVSGCMVARMKEVTATAVPVLAGAGPTLRFAIEARVSDVLGQASALLKLLAGTGEKVPIHMSAPGSSDMRIQRTAEALARLVVSMPSLSVPWTNRRALQDALQARLRILADASRELQQELDDAEEEEHGGEEEANTERCDDPDSGFQRGDEDEEEEQTASDDEQGDDTSTMSREGKQSPSVPTADRESEPATATTSDADSCVLTATLALLNSGERLARRVLVGVQAATDPTDWLAWDGAKRGVDEMTNALDSTAALSYPPLDREEVQLELSRARIAAAGLAELGRGCLASSDIAREWPALVDRLTSAADGVERAVDRELGLAPEE